MVEIVREFDIGQAGPAAPQHRTARVAVADTGQIATRTCRPYHPRPGRPLGLGEWPFPRPNAAIVPGPDVAVMFWSHVFRSIGAIFACWPLVDAVS